MPRVSDLKTGIEVSWHRLEPITSERMEAVWRVAKEEGYKDMKSFWEYAHSREWGFYDVLKITSP